MESSGLTPLGMVFLRPMHKHDTPENEDDNRGKKKGNHLEDTYLSIENFRGIFQQSSCLGFFFRGGRGTNHSR